jgi:hypothetical protein
MSKVFAFIVIMPIIVIFLFKIVMFYEFDTKQRYIKDQIDAVAYKVAMTGILTSTELDIFKTKLAGISTFNTVVASNKGVKLYKGKYTSGILQDNTWVAYNAGEQLARNAPDGYNAFMVAVCSSTVSNYSVIMNGGTSSDDSKNLYYKAKATCRIEYVAP